MIVFYQKLKAVWWEAMRRIHPRWHDIVFRCRVYIKYLFSGGTGAVVNLSVLALLVEFFSFHYLPASVIAVVIGYGVSFVLQKFFTFGDTTLHMVHRQLIVYYLLAVGNLALNTFLMYVLVDIAGIWYLAAQFMVSAVIAVESFFLYRMLVFRRH